MARATKTRIEVRRGKVRITQFALGNRGSPYVLSSIDFDTSDPRKALRDVRTLKMIIDNGAASGLLG